MKNIWTMLPAAALLILCVTQALAFQSEGGDPDTMPYFSGCDQQETKDSTQKCSFEKLVSFVGQNLKYPEQAKKEKAEGMVVVAFTVDSTGRISKANVEKGIGSGCDEEALRVIRSMPAWTPGTKEGKPVAVEMKLPIMFKDVPAAE